MASLTAHTGFGVAIKISYVGYIQIHFGSDFGDPDA